MLWRSSWVSKWVPCAASVASLNRCVIAWACGICLAACADDESSSAAAQGGAGVEEPVALSAADPVDVPIPGVSDTWVTSFNAGDTLFDVIARQADGLGPLFTRQACSACHQDALRGSGFVQKFAFVLDDGLTPAPDPSSSSYGNTVHPFMTAGATTPITPPQGANVRVTLRLGPPVIGRGYLEAVLDSEITKQAESQAAAGGPIHGRVNWVTYGSEPNPDQRFHTLHAGDRVIGRFGLKARVATLDDFAADALLFDMGLTSPLRPSEFANPDGLTDDGKPGIDLTIDSVNLRADYTRLLAIPPRATPDTRGPQLFQRARCSQCHVPTLRTRADYPIAQLADIDAPVFTDLLLHNMGDELSDSLSGTDGTAGPRDWRTAPLIGLRFMTTYLHDGRATTIRDAITLHAGNGSEANESVQTFESLMADEQDALVGYVHGL